VSCQQHARPGCLTTAGEATILRLMPELSLETLKQLAALQGYAWSDAELERIRPQVERGLALLEKLSELVSPDVEPAIQYRMF